jgi:hypothetical protein
MPHLLVNIEKVDVGVKVANLGLDRPAKEKEGERNGNQTMTKENPIIPAPPSRHPAIHTYAWREVAAILTTASSGTRTIFML